MSEKKVVSIRLAEEQVEYLKRTARRLGWTTSQTAAMLVDEGIRRERFPEIEIRPTAAGRTAYIRGTRLPVWMMADRVWRGETPEEIAESLRTPVSGILAALAYAEVFRDEIQECIALDDEIGANLQDYLPRAEIVTVDASPA
jgi:uncharacterized protein (DUF433 family)